MENKKFYLTTAIAYASGKPHIGNTYEVVLADAIARYKRLKGYDVYFQTGTDEHGQKIEQKAKEKKITPLNYVDEVSTEIKKIWDLMNTSYSKFVRTTDENHKKIVQKIFKKLYDQGDIFLDKYEGLYCTPCETFFTEKELVDGNCPDCGRKVQLVEEQTYFFKLTKYEKRLKEYIENNSEFIEPISRKNEMVKNFLEPGLHDLCVSRTSFKWGINVSFDERHIIYVWIDALSNYLSFVGYDPENEQTDFKQYWPPDIQIIGKDILRFHTIYWPILLMALDLELPKKIFGHPWLLMKSEKMSKSKGNIIYADDLVKDFGVDAVRYYLLHEIPFSSDGNITHELIIDRINGELANVLGNLVQRTISMAIKYFDKKVLNKSITTEFDKSLIKKVNDLENVLDEKMDKLEVSEALTEIFNVLRVSNKYIDETMPWVLAKDESETAKLETIIYNLLESIRVCSVFLEPFMPQTSEDTLKQLNIEDRSFKFNKTNIYNLNNPEILFKRIDKEKYIENM